MKIVLPAILLAATLASCASGSSIRTSQNSAIIQARAAPICGGDGAAQVAQQQAAIETLKAGFDSYIITDGQSANNVRVTQSIGSSTTRGMIYGNTYSASTTYQPRTIVSGSHAQSLSIIMFRTGETGAQNAISAREILGPDWAKIVQNGVMTC